MNWPSAERRCSGEKKVKVYKARASGRSRSSPFRDVTWTPCQTPPKPCARAAVCFPSREDEFPRAHCLSCRRAGGFCHLRAPPCSLGLFANGRAGLGHPHHIRRLWKGPEHLTQLSTWLGNKPGGGGLALQGSFPCSALL